MTTDGGILGGRYRLRDVIGEGTLAIVHRAEDEIARRDVAVKLVRPEHVVDRRWLHRFRRTARAAIGLGHPALVPVLDVGTDGSREYVVMELADGDDLGTVLTARGGRLPLAEAIATALALGDGLATAHGHGIVHGGVKPRDVLLRGDRVRLLDVGVAPAVRPGPGGAVPAGTAAYVCPERIVGAPLRAASDVYSLGILLYEMLTGHRPFDAPTPVATALARFRVEPRPPSAFAPNLPAALDALVIRALALDPDRRYPAAGPMADALRRWWRDGRDATPRRAPVSRRPSSPAGPPSRPAGGAGSPRRTGSPWSGG